jgi:hypothetical protein
MPYLATRIKIEERIAADHKALVVGACCALPMAG